MSSAIRCNLLCRSGRIATPSGNKLESLIFSNHHREHKLPDKEVGIRDHSSTGSEDSMSSPSGDALGGPWQRRLLSIDSLTSNHISKMIRLVIDAILFLKKMPEVSRRELKITSEVARGSKSIPLTSTRPPRIIPTRNIDRGLLAHIQGAQNQTMDIDFA